MPLSRHLQHREARIRAAGRAGRALYNLKTRMKEIATNEALYRHERNDLFQNHLELQRKLERCANELRDVRTTFRDTSRLARDALEHSRAPRQRIEEVRLVVDECDELYGRLVPEMVDAMNETLEYIIQIPEDFEHAAAQVHPIEYNQLNEAEAELAEIEDYYQIPTRAWPLRERSRDILSAQKARMLTLEHIADRHDFIVQNSAEVQNGLLRMWEWLDFTVREIDTIWNRAHRGRDIDNPIIIHDDDEDDEEDDLPIIIHDDDEDDEDDDLDEDHHNDDESDDDDDDDNRNGGGNMIILTPDGSEGEDEIVDEADDNGEQSADDRDENDGRGDVADRFDYHGFVNDLPNGGTWEYLGNNGGEALEEPQETPEEPQANAEGAAENGPRRNQGEPDAIEEFRAALDNANPEERQRLERELFNILDLHQDLFMRNLDPQLR